MKPYLSIDTETTGLDGATKQILEFGAVLDTLDRPVRDLPYFHCYIDNKEIHGDPYALSMHPTILRRIATREEPYSYYEPREVGWFLREFLHNQSEIFAVQDRPKIAAAGKNFGSFDLDFMRHQLPDVFDAVKIHHRNFDPGNWYFNPKIDDLPPDTNTCVERAKARLAAQGKAIWWPDAATNHTAIPDAQTVINLLRVNYDLLVPGDYILLDSEVLA